MSRSVDNLLPYCNVLFMERSPRNTSVHISLMQEWTGDSGVTLGAKCNIKGTRFDVVLTITKHMSAML